jgi:FixJ family two-component response regulator
VTDPSAQAVRVRAVSDEATVFLADDDRDFRNSMAALLGSVNFSSLSV